MLKTPTKRHASKSPDGARPPKRALTSSPEEGEVDDGSFSASTNLPPRPVSPPRPPKSKVAFPFKRKLDAVGNGIVSESKERASPVVYERSQADELRIREADLKRKAGRDIQGDARRRVPPTGDHWEPGMGYGRDHPPPMQRSSVRDMVHHGVDRFQLSYIPRDRERFPRERRLDWDRSTPPGANRVAHHRPDRYQPTPEPASPGRSRTSSPHLSQHREKHRLPAPRTPEPPPSPSRMYHSVRDRERQRDRGLDPDWDRRFYSSKKDHLPPWDHDRGREPHGYRRHGSFDEQDRYRRPEYPPSPHHDQSRDDRDRGWPRDESSGASHPSKSDDGQQDHMQSNHDHPTTSQSTPRPPLSPLPGSRTPPPPPISPPPAPPPFEDQKDESLPAVHDTVFIPLPLKRPGAPKDTHSPPSLRFPVAEDADIKGPKDGLSRDDGKGLQKGPESWRPRSSALVQKRVPVQRSPKEEAAAYGRVFKGCGRQKDYEITTKLGEGTFGEVHKAINKANKQFVALKRILMHNEKEGMPVTALREIKILKALNHPNIVEILDMFVVRSTPTERLSVYMVFPYMDHDLAGLLENERVKLQPSHIKLYMKQLLEGTEYMHKNHILHRDMKAANLLISNTGSLRIADFGLARSFDDHRGKERRYTNCVVTRWYRPPELLLGTRQYGGEVDMWGIGCVLGEMFSRRPILPGTSDLDQLEKIWALCGSPNQHNWPNYDALPGCEGVKRFNHNYPRRIKVLYDGLGPETCDLLERLLTCNPKERITASQALDHDYFWTDPLPADPKTLPSYEASHEYDGRRRRNPAPAGPPPPHHQGRGQFRPLPPPAANPPFYFGRGGPPRDAFHSGPPPHGAPPPHGPQPPYHQANHPPNHPLPSFPNGPMHPHGPFPNGPSRLHPPPRAPYGSQRPPYRPGQPPIPGQHRSDRWEPPQHKGPHLPPRPPIPVGKGGGPHRGDGGRHDMVNGDGGGGELNYG